MTVAAVPLDVRKVSDLPSQVLTFVWATPIILRLTIGRSPITAIQTSEGRRHSAHQAAAPH